MKTLLVTPKFVKAGQFSEFPVGLAYISATLKAHGHEVDCLNTNHSDTPLYEQIREKLKQNDFDVFATGGLSVHYNQIKEITDIARCVNKNLKIIVGGGIISSEPELIARALDADIGVLGEGEETILDLAEIRDFSTFSQNIPGIIYRDGDNGYITTSTRTAIDNLDALPFPDYDSLGIWEYLDNQKPGDRFYLYVHDDPRFVPLIASRSCPYNCTFCYHPLGKKYRTRSLDLIFSEVELVIDKYNANIIFFYDELFAFKKERLYDFCERIMKYKIKWLAQFRVDEVDSDMMRTLHESGMYYAGFGIESASNAILDSMKKHITVEQIKNALSTSKKMNVGISGCLLYGDPADSTEAILKNIQWKKGNYLYNNILMLAISPYPGTADFQYCVEQGIINDKLEYIQDGCPAVNMSGIPQQIFRRLMTKVSRVVQQYAVVGEAIFIKRQDLDHGRNIYLYSVETVCPHCRGASKYGNYNISSIGIVAAGSAFRICCRLCNQEFWLLLRPLIEKSTDSETKRMLVTLEIESYREHALRFLLMGNNKQAIAAWWHYSLKQGKLWQFPRIFVRIFKHNRRERKRMDEKHYIHLDIR